VSSLRFTTSQRLTAAAILAIVNLLAVVSLRAQVAPRDPARWESDVAAFESQDRRSPPHKGGIVFVGASSIVRWNVAEFFPDLPVLNRGFGGSEMADTAHFAARTVLPYEPRIVVLYPGRHRSPASRISAQRELGLQVTSHKSQVTTRKSPRFVTCDL
jgi:hypothetical protein